MRKIAAKKMEFKVPVRRFCLRLCSSCSEWIGRAMGPVDEEKDIAFKRCWWSALSSKRAFGGRKNKERVG